MGHSLLKEHKEMVPDFYQLSKYNWMKSNDLYIKLGKLNTLNLTLTFLKSRGRTREVARQILEVRGQRYI